MVDRSVTIRLRVSSAEFDAAMARAGISVEALAAEVRAAGAAAGEGGAGLDGFSKKADKAKFSSVGLLGTLVALSPALIPLAGAAGVAGGALVGMGTAGVTAVLGVKREMADGTRVGQQYAAGLGMLKNDFHELEQTAARATLAGFNGSVEELHRNMPAINRDMNVFGQYLGDVTKHTIAGTIAEWQHLDPELRRAAGSTVNLSARFEEWAKGPGGERFAHNLAEDVRDAVPFLQQAGTAVASIFHAAASAGHGELGAITELFRLFNGIPIGVLQAAVPTITSVALATKLLSKEAVASSAAVSSMVGTFGKLGTLGLVATGIGLLTSALSEMNTEGGKDHGMAKNLNADFKDVTGSATASAGAVLNWAESGKTQWSNVGDIVHDVTAKVVGLGVSQVELNKGILGNDAAYGQLVKTLKDKGGLDKGELGILNDLHAAYGDNSAAVNGLSTAEQGLIDKLHLTVAQSTQYAALLGVTTPGTKEWAAAVQTVADAQNTATVAGSDFLAQLQQFATSSGTAADRAAIIGATLKAANGDALAYGGAIAGAYDANRRLVESFQSEAEHIADLRKQIASGKLDTAELAQAHKDLADALDSSQRAAINLKNGTIDYTKAGAVPLIQSLQAIQDAALLAAKAQYQHEVATKGGKRAADDAYTTYVAQTRGALIDEATQLGLTKDQAKRLADQYFGMPKDIKTKIEAEGTDPILTVLNKIGQQLSFLTGHPWVTKHSADTAAARNNISGLNDAIHGLHGKTVTVGVHTSGSSEVENLRGLLASLPPNLSIGVSVNASGQIGIAGGGRYAAGSGPGGVKDGFFTVGEEGYELGYKRGPVVQIFSHEQSVAMTGMENIPGYAAGTAKPRDVTARHGDVTGLISGIRADIPGAAAAMRDLNLAVDAQFRLDGMKTKLDAARQKLTDLRKEADQFASDTRSGLTSQLGFDPTQAGTTLSGILAAFARPTAAARAFTGEFKQLSAAGLDKNYLQDLARAGGGATFDALAKIAAGPGGRAAIAQVNQAYRAEQSAITAAGSTAENSVYGKAIAAQTRNVDKLTATIRSQATRIDHLVTQVAALARRPVQLSVDGKVVAAAVGKKATPHR